MKRKRKTTALLEQCTVSGVKRLQDFNCMYDILHFIQKSGRQKNLTSNKEQTNKSKDRGLANGKVMHMSQEACLQQ
jgi:hypothetical protein